MQWVPSLLGELLSLRWKDDFAADLHMDRVIAVGVSSGTNLTGVPHLRRGSSKCQWLLSEDQTYKVQGLGCGQ